MSRTIALPVVLLTTIGCQGQFTSEEGQWAFVDAELSSVPFSGFQDDQSLVAGTEVCPTPHWKGTETSLEDEELFDSCVEQSLGEGGSFTTLDGLDCVLLETPGEVEWGLSHNDCEALGEIPDELVDDRVLFSVVDPAGVSAHVDQWPEENALGWLDLVPQDVLTESLLVADDEPFRLLEDQVVYLFVQLWDDDNDQPTAWRSGNGAVSVEAISGEVEVHARDLDAGWIAISAGSGAEAQLVIEVGDTSWVAGTVQAAAPEEIVSLDLVVAFVPEEEGSELRTPWAARAVMLDSAGRPVFGAPVEWDASGVPLVLEAGHDGGTTFPGYDYTWVEDACTAPAKQIGARAATLSASWGELSDSVEMTWTVTEDMVDLDGDWTADDRCGGGCGGCASGGTDPSGLAWVIGLLGAVLAGRRRR